LTWQSSNHRKSILANPVPACAGMTSNYSARPLPPLSLPGLTGQPSNPESQRVGERVYYVYILASRIGGTLYIGATGDLVRRVCQHREKLVKGFTEKYGVAHLVYFEQFGEVGAAIQREKQLKKWKRAWKIRLVEERNSNWNDLYPSIAVP
jgi:putative endonuclease